MPGRQFAAPPALELAATLAPLRHGPYDPTMSLASAECWRASRAPAGPATLHLRLLGDVVEAEAWGPGADWALDQAPALLGVLDEPAALRPVDPVVTELARRHPGLRLPRTGRVVEALVPAVIEQKVTGLEAQRVYRRLIRVYGEAAPAAPGAPAGLRLQPAPGRLASLPYHAFHPLGLERRRAETLIRVGMHAAALEASVALAPAAARSRIQAIPGVGPWTATEAIRVALGDPDAVSLGDYHLPTLVAWSLAGEAVADDARMLELLEPYAGQRARVVRLLELGGRLPPRRAPRLPVRSIERL